MFDGRAGVWMSVCERPDDPEPTFGPPRRIANGLMLNNARDVRVELNGFQVFVSVLVTLMTYSFAWIFVLVLKRSPAELVSFTRCTAE